ncbi:4Fe-4S binding protein [Candidatus Bathyarchaeota archaeon]|nr:4Fe-4S binding protein [Candidatus Bathyarchaeota archaeon]
MALRKLVRIDEDLCDGCGECLKACPEGALSIIDGKAKLLDEAYCDGLGACIGYCPKGAITIEERIAKPFQDPPELINPPHRGIFQASSGIEAKGEERHPSQPPGKAALRNWPIKLRLVSPRAPFLNGSDLLLAADCTPFAYPPLHSFLLPERTILIGCTKFDSAEGYAKKLEEILKWNEIKEITVFHMEVPCCHGLNWAAMKAIKSSGRDIPVKRFILTLQGEIEEVEGLD